MGDITIYHLEMLSPQAQAPAPDNPGLSVQECEVAQYALNRFMYQLVGRDWQWRERLSWTDEQWRDYAERDSLRTWLALHRGSPAGYYELERQPGNQVEIKYFGLARPFIGKGFGRYLLSNALQSAWAWDNPERVWVHTCTLDHPGALSNYRARGMRLFKTETVAN